ncbi:Lysine-specific demethylase 4B [Phytophthora boehmeriae]|uniref:Lysine-specific demethylase 4B n=1 Tax=Phytophthora boehmeriae TaxID=109152 RepID=A0A8T1X4D1_9STRA|nr:Lysine-specific demethylase 4B [Phytophthora boehmeriae]
MCPSDPRGSSLPSPSSSNGAWCPEFYPTRSEFQSFATYIRTVVEPQCADIGICKIIPPRGWFSRSYDISQLDCQVSAPVSQHVAGKKGIFNVDLVERKTMSPLEFQMMTEAATDKEPEGMKYRRPDGGGATVLEGIAWDDGRSSASLFGDADALSWNLGNLNSILRKIDLPGVTRPMLYFGMWRAMFAFHTEDMDLFSINYVHTGKPKFWYGIPPDAAPQLERAAQSMFPEKHHTCSQFLRHKTSLISPARLREFGVPFYRAYQKPGEFVITFPAAYHQGFNLGFNIAEAVNFASLHWIPYGLKAKVCKCLPDSVRIDMNSFLTKLFSGPPSGPELLGDDPWVFSCKCHKYCSSNNPNFKVEEQWFECSKCKIWAHAKVAAVEGKYIRVHYKGESVDNDEWLPVSCKELQRRIVAVEPPPVKTKDS